VEPTIDEISLDRLSLRQEEKSLQTTCFLIKDLLVQDTNLYEPKSLRAAFGDSYLCSKNSIHRAVRELALDSDICFIQNYNEFYNVAPMLQLEHIVASREIPVLNTLQVAIALEQRRPGFFTGSQLRDLLSQVNTMTHESVHILLDDLLKSVVPEKKRHDQRLKILCYLIPEAAAITVEILEFLCSEQDRLGQEFLKFSSHQVLRAPNIRRHSFFLYRQAGLKALVTAFVCGNLIKLFGYLRPSSGHLRSALKIGVEGQVSEEIESSFRFLLHSCSALSHDFVYSTTEVFFNVNGIYGSLESICSFCPFDEISTDPIAENVFRECVEWICRLIPDEGMLCS
jgi:hypothetical protein